jgi:hypothetical protein
MLNPGQEYGSRHETWQNHLWFCREIEQLGVDFIGVEVRFLARPASNRPTHKAAPQPWTVVW